MATFNYERAAMVLVDADYLGDKPAATSVPVNEPASFTELLTLESPTASDRGRGSPRLKGYVHP